MGDRWGDLGATASSTDVHIANFGITTFVNGTETTTVSIDTRVAGEHTIIYKVMDGSTGTVYAEGTRTVNVVDTTPVSLGPVVDMATSTTNL